MKDVLPVPTEMKHSSTDLHCWENSTQTGPVEISLIFFSHNLTSHNFLSLFNLVKKQLSFGISLGLHFLMRALISSKTDIELVCFYLVNLYYSSIFLRSTPESFRGWTKSFAFLITFTKFCERWSYLTVQKQN